MYLKHLTSLQFLTYLAFGVVVVAAIMRAIPGRAPPVRREPYPDHELTAHDSKVGKYFIAGGGFLVLGAVHMVLKNVPWAAEWLARAGYAGHLVRDLSNTHVMIVGGGTLIATGLCWYALPRIVQRPLASNALAQCAFWFTALGLIVFYVALIGNGIAIGRLVSRGWDYEVAKLHMGNWYKAPVGMGAGVMGVGYWCFATNVFLTVFQSRLVHVPKPHWHLWKFFATGAAALTVGTVQGVIQVQPANADWLYRAGHAGEWIDPISHAHVNLVTGLTMLVAGALFFLMPVLGVKRPSRHAIDRCFYLLLFESLAFYFAALYLGLHEGHLVIVNGLTPEQAEEATPLHPFLIMIAGTGMMAAFWLLLVTVVRPFWRARVAARPFVLVGCAALAVGTLQGPVQAFPAVNELLDRSRQAGDVIVNLHAQLNMLGGLMVILTGLALVLLRELAGTPWKERAVRLVPRAVGGGMAVYYLGGIAFAVLAAHTVSRGHGFGTAVTRLQPAQALVLIPAALAVLAGFAAYTSAVWNLTMGYRALALVRLRVMPAAFRGRIPRRVRRQKPIAVAAYELPMAVLGFPGVGWLFAGFPLAGTVILILGPALAWAVIPLAFSPFGGGPLREAGWRVLLVWLPLSALFSTAMLYRAHRRRLFRLDGRPPRAKRRRARTAAERADAARRRIAFGGGAILLLLVSLPLVPAVTGLGSHAVRYSYEKRLTREVTGQFVKTPRGPVKLYSWQDPQNPYPRDALRLHARDLDRLLVRAAAVDGPEAYRLFDLDHARRLPLTVASRSPTALALAPAAALAPGRYAFVATHEGMFGGRDFEYLRIVPPGDPVTPISDSRASAKTVMDALLPVLAAMVAALFAVNLLRSYRRRRAGEKLFWLGGFAFFAVAAACEALAQRSGWTPGLFRGYYLCGGLLTVAWLGAGTAWLVLPRPARSAMAGGLVVATIAATAAIALAPVDAGVLATTAIGRPPANDALGGHAYLWAIALNTVGTVFLLGGALWSVARRKRVRANMWIAGGALVLAAATSMSRAGEYSFVYVGELIGIVAMFAGFNASAQLGRRAPAPRAARASGETLLTPVPRIARKPS